MSIITTHSATATIALGQALGTAMNAPLLIALDGPLGSGKTHLIKGLARGLEVADPDAVTSPTFTLMNEYQGRCMLYHLDAYRLNNPHQLEALGFDELCHSDGIIIIEWASRVASVIAPYGPTQITLAHAGANDRRITFENFPDTLRTIVEAHNA